MSRKGLFIVLEGPEGAGKTTQSLRLVDELKNRGLEVDRAREPGGTSLGEGIRRLLLDGAGMHARAELLLFCAARAAFVEELVRPVLESGGIFVADRFDLSTMAYQIAGRGLAEEPSLAANAFAKGEIEPDLYILLTVNLGEGTRRQEQQGKKADRIEGEALEFHQRVHGGYFRFASKLSTVHMIDTNNLTEDEVHRQIVAELNRRFPGHLKPQKREE